MGNVWQIGSVYRINRKRSGMRELSRIRRITRASNRALLFDTAFMQSAWEELLLMVEEARTRRLEDARRL